jgi:hypothetical protein
MEELKKIDSVALSYVEKAKGFLIATNADYESAGSFLLLLKGLQKEIDKTFKPIIEKAHAAHKEAISQSKTHSKPVENAEKIIKDKIAIYLLECERKRREEQRRLEEEARKRQEEEALQAAAEAESEQEAEEIIQEAIETVPVVVAPRVESKVDGISSRKVWKWRLVNAEKMNPKFMIPDEKRINMSVRALGKVAEATIGGIQVYEETIIIGRV